MPFGDTIAALATPAGESALALIRVSGPLASTLATDCTGRTSAPPPRRATLLTWQDRAHAPLDDVVLTRYEAPASFTGEDMLEISCHGNPLLAQKILADLVSRGCRMAEPGEFTRTAFLNNKLDLSQAEAVADIISARSDSALQAARRQLEGQLGAEVKSLRDNILEVCSTIEAYIDFPEEDLPAEDQEGPLQELKRLQQSMQELAETSRYRSALHDGLSTVILGAPNVGKSSLLNALSGEDRAIVTNVPGTTRDTVEERILAGPFCLRITDTAGLHETHDELERLGIERTLRAVRSADFFLLVVDTTLPFPILPPEVLQQLSPATTLVIDNKIDLPADETRNNEPFLQDYTHVRTSLLTGAGLDVLRGTIIHMLEKHLPDASSGLIVNERHAQALLNGANALCLARELIQSGQPTELAATHLHECTTSLHEIIGGADNEAMLDHLFARFCIGK